MIDDCRAAIRPWIQNPRRRLKLELVALRKAIIPHGQNNNFRKLTLLLLVGAWTIITLGGPVADQFSGMTYTTLTALVFMIIGRQWGLEVGGLAPSIDISTTDSDDSSSDNDS